MVEQMVDMCLSPPVRSPRSQLAAEQPLTGEYWKPPKKKKKRYPMSKEKGEAATTWQEGYNHDKTKPHTHWMDNPKTAEPQHQRSFPTLLKVLSSHVRLFSSGNWHMDQESPGDLILKVCRIWLQDFHRMGVGGGQKLPFWRAQTKSCVHHDPGERSSDPTGDWTRPSCSVGGSPVEP